MDSENSGLLWIFVIMGIGMGVVAFFGFYVYYLTPVSNENYTITSFTGNDFITSNNQELYCESPIIIAYLSEHLNQNLNLKIRHHPFYDYIIGVNNLVF